MLARRPPVHQLTSRSGNGPTGPMATRMLFGLPAELGYAALFGVLLAEYTGLPVPGETVLLGAVVLAGTGHLALPVVVLLAISGAILGSCLGYAIGRRGGRMLLLRPGPFVAKRHRMLHGAERFFSRYGEAAVFLSRWVPCARYLTPLTAGAAKMSWHRFLLFNVIGGITWVASLTAVAVYFGAAGAATISAAGLVVAIVSALVAWIRAAIARRQGVAEAAAAQAAAA
jgi:membrane protein DedA with SNARE-associated domain